MELRNKKWTEGQFSQYLEKVRSWYPTGREVDMDESVEYHKKMPERKNLVMAEAKAEAEGYVLICPRVGFATVDQTLETVVYARDNSGPDFVRIAADTYTRRMEFDKAKKALDESQRRGRSLLNGLPSVVYGLTGNRHLYEAVDLPV